MQSLNPYKKRAEYRKMIRKNYLFEQLKPKLKEIFDYVDRSGASTISIIEIKEALQLLNIGHAAHKLDNIEELLANSKDSSTRSDITFEDFTNLYFHLLDYSDIQHNLKDCLVLDFVDPSMFIFASDNRIINQDFSSKILDFSVILRKRIEMKYSIYANNVDQNIKILKNVETECIKNYKNSPYLDSFLQYSYSLRDCWAWLGKCLEHRRSTNDFTQGLRNLMASLYENETTSDHIVKIAMTHYLVYSNHERQEVLEKLGWSYIDFTPKHHHAQLYGIIDQEENPARAAALCVFHFDFIRAYQCLANVENPSNELSFIISILQFLKEWQTNVFQDREVCGYMYHDSSRFHEETEELYKNPQDFTNEIFSGKTKSQKFESVKRDLKVVQMLCQNIKPSDPYFRAICKFIGNAEPLPDIIKDHNLNFMDRLAFAYRFFGPNALQNYIKETIEEAKEKGYLGALLLVGKNPEGFEIIQQYIDSTGDIQSIALLGVYLKLFRFPQEEFYKSLLTDYKDLMNQLGYWEDRINLQTRVMELEKSFSDPVKDRKVAEQTQEQAGYAASQQCYFCKSSLAHPTLLSKLSETKKSFSSMHKYEKTRINFCPDCQKPLPNCCICLLPVSVLNPFIELQEKIKRVASKKESNPIDLDEALMYCQECKHGGHFAHIHEWFQTHTKCPVTGCGCQCIQNDYE